MSVSASGTVDQGSACTLYGRITAKDATGTVAQVGEGPCLKQADIANLWFTLLSESDIPAGVVVVPVFALPKVKVIFDVLQTNLNDSGYVGDGNGFNFRYTLVPGLLAAGGRSYRATVRFVTTGGGVGFAIWDITTNATDVGSQGGEPPPCEALPYE